MKGVRGLVKQLDAEMSSGADAEDMGLLNKLRGLFVSLERPEPKRITVRYSSRCLGCGETIDVGAEADWYPGRGIQHVDPEACHAVNDANQQDGDPPPRDWGDL